MKTLKNTKGNQNCNCSILDNVQSMGMSALNQMDKI